MKKMFFLISVLVLNVFVFADVRLPAIISDNMVLEQGTEVSIWGWADPSEKISIVADWGIDGAVASFNAIANEGGKWHAKIKTPKAGGPYKLTIKGNNTIEVDNILVGEVWICSGQSNMQMPMAGWDKQPIHGGVEDIANSANKSIRLFGVNRVTSDKPLDDTVGKWVECSPETVEQFSAVGYYFARKIQKEIGFPVGMVGSYWGGTVAEAWTRIDFINNDDNLSPIADCYNTKFEAWGKSCTEAEKEQKPKPVRNYPIRPQDKPAALYNGMIASITNMTIKGVVWYQGESNAEAAYLYREVFPTMIMNWRCDFSNFDMSFYFVQLANFTQHKPGTEVNPYRGEPRDDGWAELREAQLMTNRIKNTGMAVAIDIGAANNIHPGNKKAVGERLALWALANDYGMDIEYSGPLYEGYWVEGGKIRIIFSHADSGLEFKSGKVKGFAIAGKDRKFIWADAKIEGKTVVVSSDQIKEPVSVRYAWDIDPESSLYNKSDLPASPFRTDDWNGVTFVR